MNSYPQNTEEEIKEEEIDFAGLFFKYLRYWKWFVASVIVCLIFAVLYLKHATPVYQVKATVLLKDDKKGSSTAELSDALRDISLFNEKDNVDNELEILKASTLAEQTVRELGLYASYTEIGSFRNTVIYGKSSPIQVWLSKDRLDALHESINFDVTVCPGKPFEFTGSYHDHDFRVKAAQTDTQVVLPFGQVCFRKGCYKPAEAMTVGITLQDPVNVADNLLGRLNIALTSKSTSVVNMVFHSTQVEMGTDFVNKFIDVYNREDMKDQNIVATNTAIFINERLATLSRELNSVELQVENYKQNQGLTDISSEANLFIQQTGAYEQKRLDVETQLGVIESIDSYIRKKENRDQLLPASTGLKSESLAALIDQYNSLLLEHKRLSRTASEKNQAMVDLNNRIDAMFGMLQASVRREKNNWQIARQDLIRNDNANEVRIKAIPRQEREYMEIKRQQSIKESLFIFLLQNKEKNDLSMSLVVPKAKIINSARSNGAPVSPKRNIILLIALLCGLGLPVAFLFVGETLRYQVENKKELEKLSPIPVLGVIPKREQAESSVMGGDTTDCFSERLRLLRANLLFILNEPDKKIISVVSSLSGEGKSFVAINLAISLAHLDKKVLIMGLDLRKPSVGKNLSLGNETGMSLFLSGRIGRDTLVRPSGLHPGLSVITAGPIPPNPNDLLAKPALDELMAQLRVQFDYIVLDTTPLSIFADSFLLNRFADVNLCVVRSDYTPRKNIEEINNLYQYQKLNNLYLVLNASDISKDFHYHYGKKYGYEY